MSTSFALAWTRSPPFVGTGLKGRQGATGNCGVRYWYPISGLGRVIRFIPWTMELSEETKGKLGHPCPATVVAWRECPAMAKMTCSVIHADSRPAAIPLRL